MSHWHKNWSCSNKDVCIFQPILNHVLKSEKNGALMSIKVSAVSQIVFLTKTNGTLFSMILLFFSIKRSNKSGRFLNMNIRSVITFF